MIVTEPVIRAVLQGSLFAVLGAWLASGDGSQVWAARLV